MLPKNINESLDKFEQNLKGLPENLGWVDMELLKSNKKLTSLIKHE